MKTKGSYLKEIEHLKTLLIDCHRECGGAKDLTKKRPVKAFDRFVDKHHN